VSSQLRLIVLLEDAVATRPEGATSEPDVVASAPWAHTERPSRWQRLIICRRHTARRLPVATHAAIVSRHPRRHRRPMEEASAEVTSVDIAKTASQSPRPAVDILRRILITHLHPLGFSCKDVSGGQQCNLGTSADAVPSAAADEPRLP
jgi:hypothetical protein